MKQEKITPELKKMAMATIRRSTRERVEAGRVRVEDARNFLWSTIRMFDLRGLEINRIQIHRNKETGEAETVLFDYTETEGRRV